MPRKPILHFGGIDAYSPQALLHMVESELRKEYSRLRDIAQKRLKRMKEAGFGWTEEYKSNVGKFPKLAEIINPRHLRHRLTMLADFLVSKGSTVTGQRLIRDKTMKSLDNAGYGFVDESNYRDFTRFMGWARSAYSGVIFDSDEVALWFEENYDSHRSYGKLQKAFAEYVKEEKKPVKIKRNKSRMSSKRFKESFGSGGTLRAKGVNRRRNKRR